jgi:hypothetical protein
MYTVDSVTFTSFTDAINQAKVNGNDVYLANDIERGPVWTASKVSAKKKRQCLEQLSAYNAQKKIGR